MIQRDKTEHFVPTDVGVGFCNYSVSIYALEVELVCMNANVLLHNLLLRE